MASVFNSVRISSLLEVHAPLKHRKITSITVEIKNLMKERDLAKKRGPRKMLPIGQTIRYCGIKSLLNFVPGYRNTTITLLLKPKTIRKLCGKQ